MQQFHIDVYSISVMIYAEHSPSITTGRELPRFGQVDEVLGHRVLRRQPLEVGTAVPDALDVDPAEELGRRLAGLRARCAYSSIKPLDDLRASAAPEPWRPAGRRCRRAPCTPPPTITKYCGTARPSTRRTLPWNPSVAMWCWPQPFGQPLILMRAPSAGGNQIGPRAQMVLEQPARVRATA